MNSCIPTTSFRGVTPFSISLKAFATDTPYSSPIAEEKEKIGQMEEYYKQYIEEYYEIEDDKAVNEVRPTEVVGARHPKCLLSAERGVEGVFDVEELIHILREERAVDIACIEVPPSAGPHHYVVVCCPYNFRHSQALVQTIRKCYKIKCNLKDDLIPRTAKNAAGWHCFEMGNIILHVMTPEARAKYDLETLWGIGYDVEGVDDDNQLPPGVSA